LSLDCCFKLRNCLCLGFNGGYEVLLLRLPDGCLLVVALEQPVYQLFQLGDLFGGSFFGLSLALQLACGSEDLDGLCRRLAGARSAVALRPLLRAIVAAKLCTKLQLQLSEGHSFQGFKPRDPDKNTSDLTYMLSALSPHVNLYASHPSLVRNIVIGQLTTHSQDPTAKNSSLHQHGCPECDFGR
jgi:hypothetical protein